VDLSAEKVLEVIRIEHVFGYHDLLRSLCWDEQEELASEGGNMG
jgi:hypothetical protein